MGYNVTGDATNGYYITVRVNGSDGNIQTAFKPSDKNVGNVVNIAFSYYTYNTFHFEECGDVHIENVTVHASASMAFVGLRCQNLYINRFKVVLPENSKRLLTANADGLHIEQGSGKVVVTNCLVEYNQDDALNIKAGYYYEFSSFDLRNKTITISKIHTLNIPETPVGTAPTIAPS